MQWKIIEPKLYIYLLQHVSLGSHLPFIQGYFKFSNLFPIFMLKLRGRHISKCS